MRTRIDRRSILAGGLILPLFALPGCAGGLGGYGLTEAIRRILTLSSQRAFATLLQPGGFYDDQLARIALPPQFGGQAGPVVAAILGTSLVRNQLVEVLNGAAVEGAERAAPLVADAIRNFTVADAVSIIRAANGDAATRALRGQMGDALVNAMFPEVGTALRVANSPVLGQLLGAATGIDIAGLGDYVSREAANGIYAAMGREEAAIRADPGATNDPVIMGAFGLM